MTEHEAARLAQAIELAAQLHSGQRRKYTNDPYIVHPLRVMAAVELEEAEVRIAAVLHDTVEDTAMTLTGVRRDFGDEVARLVDAVSRRDGESYTDFITRIIEAGPKAITIKIADVKDNMASGSEGRRNSRYSKAMLRLMAALDD